MVKSALLCWAETWRITVKYEGVRGRGAKKILVQRR